MLFWQSRVLFKSNSAAPKCMQKTQKPHNSIPITTTNPRHLAEKLIINFESSNLSNNLHVLVYIVSCTLCADEHIIRCCAGKGASVARYILSVVTVNS